ncbi:MAG: hypothetical protein ACI4F9_09910 [Lachnospiraceae bacterium]
MKRIVNKVFSFLLVLTIAFLVPVAASQSNAASTSVKVTLEVLRSGVSTSVNSATYYVTAYSDSACTKVVSTKSITLSNASSGSVTFTDLAATTYYFAESNSSGTLKKDTSTLTISYPYGNIVYVTANDTTTKELKIQNNYSVDPNTASARTADESQPLLFGAIAILCVLVGGTVILIRRKHA